MNIETLIEICRPGDVKNWCMDATQIENDKVEQFELIEDFVTTDSSYQSQNSLDSHFIIKNKETGDLYEITTTHDSWEEDLYEAFSSAHIEQVKTVEVTKTEYQTVSRISINKI